MDNEHKIQHQLEQLMNHVTEMVRQLAAVRSDVNSLQSELRAEMSELRGEMNDLAAKTKQGFDDCNESIAALRNEARMGWQEFAYQDHNLRIRVKFLEDQVTKISGARPPITPSP